jgi:outer membrane protein assembly factor BamB
VFGIDTMTGAPVWRQQIGVDGPFFPLRDASTSSLIMFDSVRQELLRVEQNSGKVIWRQPIAEAVSSRPLIDEGQIFLPTTGGRLYRFDLETGAAGGRLTFSQEISNPVALVDGKRLVVAGDREVFYTLTKRPFACVGVSYLGQPSGSIAAVVLSMGPYVLAAENQADKCRLRLLTTEPADQPIREVATQEIGGQVIDAPVVRGRDLFVPSTGERVFTFQVSDDAGQPPLSPGPAFEVKGAKPTTTYLAAAPDGELFMASTALRKLQLSVDALQPTQEAILKGSASQPLQSAGATMFVARQRPFSDGIVFTPIDRSTLAGDWQVIAGSPILATSVVSGATPSAVSVTDAGQIFRVTAKLLESGGFLSVAERLQLNDDLVDPLLATALPEGQLMVTCGPPEPKLWFINRLGQVERTLTLQVPMQAAPALLGARVLSPVAGGIQLLQGSSAQPAAQEYRLPGDVDPSAKWKSVFAVGEDQGVGVLNNGMLFSVRLQKAPKPHLAEAGRFSLDAPLAGRASFSGPHLAVASAAGRVVAFDAGRLEPIGERQYPSALSGGPWLAGDLVLVEVGGTELQALGLEADLPERWKLPLEGGHVAGAPLVLNENLLIAMQDGRVLACDAKSGTVQATQTLACTAAEGPLLIGTRVYIPTLDGALVPADGGQP